MGQEMSEEKVEDKTPDQEEEERFWNRMAEVNEAAFDRVLAKLSDEVEEEEEPENGKTQDQKADEPGDGGGDDSVRTEPRRSDAERKREAGRRGSSSYWERVKKILY